MPAKGSVRHFAQKPQKRMQCMSDVRIEKKAFAIIERGRDSQSVCNTNIQRFGER